jgi:hypothetical protein
VNGGVGTFSLIVIVREVKLNVARIKTSPGGEAETR